MEAFLRARGSGSSRRRWVTAERAAAVGVNVEKYFDADGNPRRETSTYLSRYKVVTRAERAQEDPEAAERAKAAESRRKRVRRVEEGKEDRDALRELARCRDYDALLGPTPNGLRETAMDGTPRRAKQSSEQLRGLTTSFYARLSAIGCTVDVLKEVAVKTTYWEPKGLRGWTRGTRPLKRYKGQPTPLDV